MQLACQAFGTCYLQPEHQCLYVRLPSYQPSTTYQRFIGSSMVLQGCFSLHVGVVVLQLLLVAMALPLVKLGALFVRQLAKPVATRVKSLAAEHRIFRKGCVAFAQGWHRMQVQVALRTRGHTPSRIVPLDEVQRWFCCLLILYVAKSS